VGALVVMCENLAYRLYMKLMSLSTWRHQTVKTGRSLQVTVSARQISLVIGQSV